MRRQPPQIPNELQQLPQVTPMVKKLIIINAVVWFVGAVILEPYVLKAPYLTLFLSLIPITLIKNYYFWQPLTYMFYHTANLWHILFNMLILWWLGSEMERHWGSRFFLIYYLACGVGAAFLYILFVVTYSLITGSGNLLQSPVLGASGAIFGLLVAYGLVFGERIVYFMFFFPMKAKWFVALLGGIDLVLILNTGVENGAISNLAHISGAVAGFLFLWIWSRTRGGPGGKGPRKKSERKGNLKLVVNNTEEFTAPEHKPKYWN